MIIDIHTHTYPEKIVKKAISLLEQRSHVKAKTNGMQDGLINSTKEAGIDLSVILPVATNPHQVPDINNNAYKINLSSARTKVMSFGAIHPDTPDIKKVLRGIKSLGIKGIKLHPDYQDTFFNDIKYKRIVEFATELGLYTVVHAGVDVGMPDPVHAPPKASYEVLKDTRSDKLILAHMGGWKQWREVLDVIAGENVYLDTAVSMECMPDVEGLLDEESFIELVRAHGADKVLFGTDSPWMEQKRALEWIEGISLTEDEKSAILGDNAAKILEIS